MAKKTAAIVGSGNIGTGLMFKLIRRSKNIDLKYMIGVDPASDGLARSNVPCEGGVAPVSRASSAASSGDAGDTASPRRVASASGM